MEFQSGLPTIYYRISNSVHGVCVDIFWNSPLWMKVKMCVKNFKNVYLGQLVSESSISH